MAIVSGPSMPVLAALERNRTRLWALCYRMTGERADADDLTQEAAARAIERAEQCTAADATGWLLALATRLCLDHLRQRKRARRRTELVDLLDCVWADAGTLDGGPEQALLLREEVRFAVLVALQRLTPRQRAALILHEVCDRPLDEVGQTLGLNANACKALVHRARLALEAARRRTDVDVPVDREVVEAFAIAVERGSIDSIGALLADDAWGIVDGGGVIQTASKPTFGRRVIERQWTNAKRKLGQPVTADVRVLNGEPMVVIRLAAVPAVVVAIVHVETRAGLIRSLRVLRDPRRIARAVAPAR